MIAHVLIEVDIDSFDVSGVGEIVNDQIIEAWKRDAQPSILRWSVLKVDIPIVKEQNDG